MIKKSNGIERNDIFNFEWLEELTISPDGRWTLYSVKRADATANGYKTEVNLVENASGKNKVFFRSKSLVTAICWKKDSSGIAWVDSEEGVPRLVVLDVKGNIEKSFNFEGNRPAQLDFSPDGKRIVYSRWIKIPNHQDGSYVRPDEIPAPTIKVVKTLRYKRDGIGWVEGKNSQLFILNIVTGEELQITDSDGDKSSPVWNYAGDKIAYTETARLQNISLGYGQIQIYDDKTKETKLMNPTWKGAAVSPQWRNDDKVIAFAGHNAEPPVKTRMFYHVWTYDLENNVVKELSAEKNDTVGNYAVADQRAGLSNITVKWGGGKGSIYCLLTEQGATHLYRCDENAKCEEVVGGKRIVFEYSPASDGSVVYGMSNPGSPGELYFHEDNKEDRQLSNLNNWLKEKTLAIPEEYWFDGKEGSDIHAWELKPIDFDSSKKYPTIIYVHCSMFSWDFHHEFQCLANSGYLVYYFNQIGTTAGYGQEWTRATEGDQGGRDYREIMAGVDEVVSRSYVDGERLGVTGGSCGGFMTNWIIGHTDRFKAAVTQRSISNEISCFGTSDIGPAMAEGETNGGIWDNMQKMWNQSPLAYADKVVTPTLIIHSDEDHRCPLEQAEQFFAALKWNGCEVEMVIFEGESHGLSRAGKPGNRIERIRRIVDWFDRYLKS